MSKVWYIEECPGNYPGDINKSMMLDGMHNAMKYGVNCIFLKEGGYKIEGEEGRVRDLLSQWYEDYEIDKILESHNTNYKD